MHTPACILDIVSLHSIVSGTFISISGSLAVPVHRAFAISLIPGDVTSASNTPSALMRSYVVAVPKSTVRTGPPYM